MKVWIRDKLFIPLIGMIIAYYIKLVFYTGRWIVEADLKAKKIIEDNSKGAIFILWHGRLLMPIMGKPSHIKMFVIVSKNKIGDIAYHYTKYFNVSLIRGSAFNPKKPQKLKGGGEALKETIEVLKNGGKVIITPDGPKGPYHILKIGAILAAKKANVPIIPVSATSSGAIIFKTWDKFLFPLPFIKGKVAYGEPIYLNPLLEEGSTEQDRVYVEKKLQEFSEKLDENSSKF